MSLNLVYYGNETLCREADEVKEINSGVVSLVDSMFNIMYKKQGIGLAAPQVNVSRRVVVVDLQDKKLKPLVLINPEVKEFSSEEKPYEEGCLSVPGIMHDVIRPDYILVRAADIDGKIFEFEAGGLLARVVQHEVDHLNGILFIDRLEDYVKKEYRAELKKIKKLNCN